MAKHPQGNIPNNRNPLPVITHASVASNGANAILGFAGPWPYDVRVRTQYWQPTGADFTVSTATATASYRRIDVYNGGAAGTATATASRIGSLSLQASIASRSTAGFTIDSTVTVAAGNTLYFSQSTVGGADANGTVLPAGQISGFYEII